MSNIAIGGVGGSGTRVVSQIVQKLGFFMGYDLNESYDTLLFTLLFKRTNILTCSSSEFDYSWNIFKKVMSKNLSLNEDEKEYLTLLASNDRTLHRKEWLKDRLNYIEKTANHNKWGWKEPNTHIIIEQLLEKEKDLKFVFVYRNGLDMAYSTNQNQLKLWADIFLNDKNIEISPKNSLKYWCLVQRKMITLQKKYPHRVFLLDFDALCLQKEETLNRLLTFMGESLENIEELKCLISAPSSIGRHKKEDLSVFDKEDMKFIEKIYK